MPTDDAQPRPVMTVAQVAHVVGVHESTVRRWLRHGQLGHVLLNNTHTGPGRRIRITAAQLDAFLTRHNVDADDDELAL